MKRILVTMLIAVLWLCPVLSQADFDISVLMEQENCQQWTMKDFDLVYRTQMIPFMAEVTEGDRDMNMMLDFMELSAERAVALRLTVSICGDEVLYADTMTVTAGGKTYSFQPKIDISEYDLVFYEDYYVCLSDEGLKLAEALMKGKGSCTVTLSGGQTVTGIVSVPAGDVQEIYALYKRAGGLEQDLTAVAESWPVTITK